MTGYSLTAGTPTYSQNKGAADIGNRCGSFSVRSCVGPAAGPQNKIQVQILSQIHHGFYSAAKSTATGADFILSTPCGLPAADLTRVTVPPLQCLPTVISPPPPDVQGTQAQPHSLG